MSKDERYIQDPIIKEDAEIAYDAQEERRGKYLKRLAQNLKDPEFRKIEGFPIGTDDAILALSDPPYYTACPNPFLEEIIGNWQEERQVIREELGLHDETEKSYRREPFATDVSEGKFGRIYNAHSYHTKVPHKAIMRYILHYTDPGDIIFDGFCGTGMTGVAAQLCGDKKEVLSLGYRVDDEGVIYDEDHAISHLGVRKAVLNDLSPAATHIAYNYNTSVDNKAFEQEAKTILREVEKECCWMYETWHPHCDHPNRVKGKINYTVWSDVFRCPQCGKEMCFWDVAVNLEKKRIRRNWECSKCNTLLSKNPGKKSGALRIERVLDTKFDIALGLAMTQVRHVPVLVNYSVGKKRYEKSLDLHDHNLLRKIESMDISYDFPIQRMPKGSESRRNDDTGLTHVHHYFTKRNLWVMACYLEKIKRSNNYNALMWSLTSIVEGSSLLNRERASGIPSKLSGTLYVSSMIREINSIDFLTRKIKKLSRAKLRNVDRNILISTLSSTNIRINDNSFDYLFIDPPFGENLMYSELNYFWESWLEVFTENQPEAIINREQKKDLDDYETLMRKCFVEFFHLLKPGRWMTVEFHNSKNVVWNSILDSSIKCNSDFLRIP